MIRPTIVARRAVFAGVATLVVASVVALPKGQGTAPAPQTPRPVPTLLVQVQNMYTPLKTN